MNLWKIWTETLDFNNRLKRKPFFIFIPIMFIMMAVTQVLVPAVFHHIDAAIQAGPLTSSISLLFTLPALTASIRRIHDAGHRAWWILVPAAGFVLLFFKSADFDKDWSWGPVFRARYEKLRLISPAKKVLS